MSHLLRDIRYAARALMRTPLFTLGIVLTLALGIGANAAMFGVVDTLFLRPPVGVHHADGVVRIYVKRNDPFFGVGINGTTTYPAFTDLRDGGMFAHAAAISVNATSLGRGTEAQRVNAAWVSPDYFRILEVGPQRGRVLGAADEPASAERSVVLSDAFWRGRLGGDTAIVGHQLQIGKSVFTVVGVAARGFGGIDLKPVDLWLPISQAAGDAVPSEAMSSRGWWWIGVLARLKDGQRPEDAAALATIAYRRGMMTANKGDSTATVVLGPIQEARGPEASSESKVSAWIGFVAAAVLLIACANVANLLLARGVARRRELALRAGLGAGRAGLVRLLLSESIVLSVLGGGAALLLATWGGTTARAFLIPNAPADAPVLDARVVAFTALAILVTAVLTGLVPAIQSSRTDVAEALKSGGHGATARGGRTRAALLVFQVALTLVLLVGAGLFVRSLRNVQGIDLGFDADRVLEATVDLKAAGMGTAEANAAYLAMLERVQRVPGVEAAAATLALYGWGFAITLKAEGTDSIPRIRSGGPYVNAVTPGYFRTLGTRLERGRGIQAGDVAGSARVAVVNATMARLVWPGMAPIGKCLYMGSDTTRTCTQVVGVVADAKRGEVTEAGQMLYYVPLAQQAGRIEFLGKINGLVIRSSTHASDLIDRVRHEMQASGNLPFADVHSLSDRVAPQYRSWRLGAAAFTAFGALALLIAAMGVFAVISYSVSRRTQEIGIRMALGAEATQVARMVLGQGLRASAVGVVAGGVGALALGRAIKALLYGVAPTDPLVFAGTAVVLLAVATAAAWLPARRAAHTDPMVALRSE